MMSTSTKHLLMSIYPHFMATIKRLKIVFEYAMVEVGCTLMCSPRTGYFSSHPLSVSFSFFSAGITMSVFSVIRFYLFSVPDHLLVYCPENSRDQRARSLHRHLQTHGCRVEKKITRPR